MNKLLILITFILTDNLSLPGQTKDWNTIDKDNYSISYPKEWELNESGHMGASFILFSPVTSQTDQFRENVNLLIQDLTGYNLDLDKYVEISEDQIKTVITNGKIIESQRISDQATSYHKVIYTGKKGDYNLMKFEQYFWVVDNKAYVLTLTCQENEFDNFQIIGEKIMDTFKIK